jgi:hypothetical protein
MKNKRTVVATRYAGVLFVFMFGFLAIIGSGGGGGSEPSPPKLIGDWKGTFVSSDNSFLTEITFSISTQNGDNFEGTWTGSTNSPFFSTGKVDGYIYPSSKGDMWRVNLDLYSGRVTCCVPLFGCYDRPRESFNMLGYFENESVVDEEASHRFACIGGDELGTMTVSRQPQP